MQIQQNISLRALNTFGIDAKAAFYTEVHSLEDLRQALASPHKPILILGGGSNMLFTQDFGGLVIKNGILGMKIVREYKNKVWIEVGAGEKWHDFVLWAVDKGFGGIENLSLIPGSIGAGPIQNIGAYGVELKDVLVKLKAMDLQTGQVKSFSNADCKFGYRESIFKKSEKGKYCITSVTFSLTKHKHRINFSYGDIQKTLEANGVHNPGISDISRAVVEIRTSKLPDPAKIGNSGSFFKNPETERSILEKIKKDYPQVPFFDLPDNRVKIPAGWLIEQCGWKGKRVGNTGSYERQALVLVNYGGATGQEVQQLAKDIIASVEQKFGVRLEAEVNLI
jgi:UDP-N-acetylmuramate dehydrogenase